MPRSHVLSTVPHMFVGSHNHLRLSHRNSTTTLLMCTMCVPKDFEQLVLKDYQVYNSLYGLEKFWAFHHYAGVPQDAVVSSSRWRMGNGCCCQAVCNKQLAIHVACRVWCG